MQGEKKADLVHSPEKGVNSLQKGEELTVPTKKKISWGTRRGGGGAFGGGVR